MPGRWSLACDLLEPDAAEAVDEGETSATAAGHQRFDDCDNDALLFKVKVEGDGLVCHEAR